MIFDVLSLCQLLHKAKIVWNNLPFNSPAEEIISGIYISVSVLIYVYTDFYVYIFPVWQTSLPQNENQFQSIVVYIYR